MGKTVKKEIGFSLWKRKFLPHIFPTLKKGIIQLFIVSLPQVPEFWCSFFSNTKLLIFGNFYFIIGKV